MTLPVTILARQKLAAILTTNNALQQQITSIAQLAAVSVPVITSAQINLSSASPEISDQNMQLTYPRVCIYSTALKNTHFEKFKSLSGAVSVSTDVWASGNLVTDTDQWIHFYVEAITELYRQNVGNLNDGFYFSGAYDVAFVAPKAGGLGFYQSATITCSLDVSQV